MTAPTWGAVRERVKAFVEERVYPAEAVLDHGEPAAAKAVLAGLMAEAKAEGLWALGHPTHIGGQGMPFLDYVHVNEVVGRSQHAMVALGTHSLQDSLMLDRYAAPEWRAKYLLPLVAGEIFPSFAMTEPEIASSDPTQLQTAAILEGDEWVIRGRKWFTTGAAGAAYTTVMCRTEGDEAPPHAAFSMIVVPTDTPGYTIVRDTPVLGLRHGLSGHYEVAYDDVRVPAANLLGPRGQGFAIAQMRLGPGRIFHCMRWLGQAQRAFDLMCRRMQERVAGGEPLADKQLMQKFVFDSAAEIQAARLLTLGRRRQDRRRQRRARRDRPDQGRRCEDGPRRRRPRGAGVRRQGPDRRHAAVDHVPPRPRGAHLRRPRRGPRDERRQAPAAGVCGQRRGLGLRGGVRAAHAPRSLRRRVFGQLDLRLYRHLSATNGIIIGVIVAAVVLSVAETEPGIVRGNERWFAAANIGFGIVFLIEYVLRLWSVAERAPQHAWRERLRFVVSMPALIDVLAIASSLTPLLGFNSTPLRLVRLARIVMLVRVGPFARACSLLGQAVASRRFELLVTAGLALIVLMIGATVLYWAEGAAQPDAFGSIPRAMWWAAETLTTVGYGDVRPVTPLGKLMAAIMAFAGIGVIALPAGIMASAFSDAMQQHRERLARIESGKP